MGQHMAGVGEWARRGKVRRAGRKVSVVTDPALLGRRCVLLAAPTHLHSQASLVAHSRASLKTNRIPKPCAPPTSELVRDVIVHVQPQHPLHRQPVPRAVHQENAALRLPLLRAEAWRKDGCAF